MSELDQLKAKALDHLMSMSAGIHRIAALSSLRNILAICRDEDEKIIAYKMWLEVYAGIAGVNDAEEA